MRSAKNIEQFLKNADLDIEINAETDRTVLGELVGMHQKSTVSRAVWPTVPRSSAMTLAALVAVVTMIVVLVAHHRPSEPEPAQTGHRRPYALELATAISLEKAFRQGGLEAVENQYRKAFGTSRRESHAPSIEELLAELETETENLGGKNI